MSNDVYCTKCHTEGASKRCSRCRATPYCSVDCQNEHWKIHKTTCIPALVHGIVIHCNRDRGLRRGGPFEAIDILPDHPIHNLGEVPPVSKDIRLPLVVYRHERIPWMDREDDSTAMDNQIATYLMIDKTGFAPQIYQKQVGSITVMRKDGKPLTEQSIETIWMFHDHLLNLFGDEPSIAIKLMERSAFDRFCNRYKSNQVENNRRSFNQMGLPL